MAKINKFKYKKGKSHLPLPLFFPDATRAVLKTIDSVDIKNSHTPGVLVNTYHLYKELGQRVVKKFGGIREFMNWDGAVISDSGGFQIMSLVKSKSGKGKITDEGVIFHSTKKSKKIFTPEKSIQFQMNLQTDMVVVLDDFTKPKSTYEEAKETVERTISWAKRSKDEFIKICRKEKLSKGERPYILGVVQGGDFLDLREECARSLAEIGFDGFGYGGWPIMETGEFNFEVAKCIAEELPSSYFLFGLGIGKPEEIVVLHKMGYNIFDCVLPTRDARHGRLYVYNANSIDKIDINKNDFYSYYVPDKQKYFSDDNPVSKACDCLLCTKYSRAYLAHLARINEITALRLSTIHNLRFYSLLMERLRRKGK